MISAIQKRIRVKKEDSAFVYFVLESHEGVTSYSTLDFKNGDPFRDLILQIPPDFYSDVRHIVRVELKGLIVDELDSFD